MRGFRMESGRFLIAKLVDIDSADYQWTADDTGQRDLTWEVIDDVSLVERSPISLNLRIEMASGKKMVIKYDELLEPVGFSRRPIGVEDIIARNYENANA